MTSISTTVQEQLEGEHPLLVNLAPFFTAIEQNISAYNSAAAQLAAAEGDRDAAVKSWMDNTTDPDAVALREVINEATNRLKTLADAAVGDTSVSEEEKARIKTLKEEAEKKLRASSRAVRGMAEPFSLDITPILRKLGDPFTPKQATGTGSGLPRPSVHVTVMKNNNFKQVMAFENLSSAANYTDYDLEQLGRHYARTAGVPYEEIAKITTVQEFEWKNSALKDAPLWKFTITPKEGAKRGRQAVQKVEETVDTENVA